jgi:hypothetical protein
MYDINVSVHHGSKPMHTQIQYLHVFAAVAAAAATAAAAAM